MRSGKQNYAVARSQRRASHLETEARLKTERAETELQEEKARIAEDSVGSSALLNKLAYNGFFYVVRLGRNGLVKTIKWDDEEMPTYSLRQLFSEIPSAAVLAQSFQRQFDSLGLIRIEDSMGNILWEDV